MKNKTLVENAQRWMGESDLLKEDINNYKLLVRHIIKEISEDNYEEGEIGKRQTMMDEKIGKTFNSMFDFKEYCKKNYGFDDEDAWGVIDNRIIYQQLENDNGDKVETTDAEYKKFVDNQMNLWTADYDFLVELILPAKSDEDAIREWTGIKE